MIDPASAVTGEFIAVTIALIFGVIGIGILLVKQAKRKREQG